MRLWGQFAHASVQTMPTSVARTEWWRDSADNVEAHADCKDYIGDEAGRKVYHACVTW